MFDLYLSILSLTRGRFGVESPGLEHPPPEARHAWKLPAILAEVLDLKPEALPQ